MVTLIESYSGADNNEPKVPSDIYSCLKQKYE